MVSVGSLPVSGQQLFDLDTHAGIMHVLASVRASDCSSAHKSELRDLVFLYSNGGKDQSVRIALEQKLLAYAVAPLAPKVKEEPKKEMPPQPVIGKYRTAPSFTVRSVQTPAASVVETRPAAAVAPEAPSVVAAPVQAVEDPVATPVRVRVEPTVPSQPQPVVPPQPVVSAPDPIPAPSPTQPQPDTIPVATVISPDNQEFLVRIREIKASVNEKVGNPVNLVDIDNEVGREYMGAILDAMKKLNSGTSAASAMKRLEDAYAAVLRTLEKRDDAQGLPEVPVTTPVTPIAKPESIVVREAPTIIDSQATPVTEASVVPTPPPIAPQPMRRVAAAQVLSEEPEEEPLYPPAPRTGKLPIQEVPQAEPSPAASVWQAPAQPAAPVIQTPPPAPTPTPAVSAPPSGFSSPFVPLSDVKEKPLSMSDLPTSESLKQAVVAGDPLFTQEVDDGLNQLLSEWSIFKKSGLFGTGPKGKEHPLFKKMAPLSIPLLLAGRFEGATQEIKQSVTDYMNGWRYEQGLIYQQGETFEHYLRRVIRHILDLQKG